jgi:hypothetical protein
MAYIEFVVTVYRLGLFKHRDQLVVVALKGIVRRKLRWVYSNQSICLPITLNRGYFIFKLKGTPSLKFNKIFVSV